MAFLILFYFPREIYASIELDSPQAVMYYSINSPHSSLSWVPYTHSPHNFVSRDEYRCLFAEKDCSPSPKIVSFSSSSLHSISHSWFHEMAQIPPNSFFCWVSSQILGTTLKRDRNLSWTTPRLRSPFAIVLFVPIINIHYWYSPPRPCWNPFFPELVHSKFIDRITERTCNVLFPLFYFLQ